MGACVSKPNLRSSTGLRSWCGHPQPTSRHEATKFENGPTKICMYRTDTVSGLSRSQSIVDYNTNPDLVNEPTAAELLCAELRQVSVKLTKSGVDTSVTSRKSNFRDKSLNSTRPEIFGDVEVKDGLIPMRNISCDPISENGDFGPTERMASKDDTAELPELPGATHLVSNHLLCKGSSLRLTKSATKQSTPRATLQVGLVSSIAKMASQHPQPEVDAARNVNAPLSACGLSASEPDNEFDICANTLVRMYSTDRDISTSGASRPPADYIVDTSATDVYPEAGNSRAGVAAAELQREFSQTCRPPNNPIATAREKSAGFVHYVPTGKVKRCVAIFDTAKRSSEMGTLAVRGYSK